MKTIGRGHTVSCRQCINTMNWGRRDKVDAIAHEKKMTSTCGISYIAQTTKTRFIESETIG